MSSSPALIPVSAEARSARRLSLRSTEEMLRRVLERVSKAPDQLHSILAEYGEPLVAFAENRRVLAANRAAETFFGHPSGSLEGSSLDVLLPVRMRQPDAPTMQMFDTLTTVEMPGLRTDGKEPPLSWTFGSVTASGAPLFVMVVRDRAEIDDALEALYASEQRFRLLVEGVRDHAVILLDADGCVATWNSGAARIKGWAADEIIGKPYATFFRPEDRDAAVPERNLAEARAKGHVEMAGWRVRKDGSVFFAEASVWALYAADGTLQGYAKITHDLTARRAAEDAQRTLEVERAGREAAEAGRDRLARLHRAAQALSRSTTPNEVVEAVLGEVIGEVHAAAGIVYTLEADTNTVHLLDQRGHAAGVLDPYASMSLADHSPTSDALRGRKALFFHDAEALTAEYPDLEPMIRTGGFEASVSLPLMTSHHPVGVLTVRFSERHEFGGDERSLLLTLAELCAQALERARLFADAEAANRAKDEFLAMLGHELRNPLAPIATAVELMKLRGDTTTKRERDVIERQLSHITRLVDDLLDVSRITRGKLELSRRDVDIADVIGRAVEMASPLLEQRQHRLVIDAARGLFVHGDAARLAQVIGNLLTNAAKYTPRSGRISISARGTATDVTVSVVDNGEGIPPELLPRVFELFMQGARTFDRSAGGLGIGLALVRNLVALHGGTVTAHSAGISGQGSTFTIRLPRVDGKSEPARDISSVQTAPHRKRVLLVDDNRDFAEMLAATLTELGYDVVFELDGPSALDRLREFPAEAAVLDLGLPVIDGFELARQIRDQLGARAPRLIAITGYGQPHDRERSAEVGFAAHLVKPIDIKAILTELERTD